MRRETQQVPGPNHAKSEREEAVDRKTATAMRQRTGFMLCPRCGCIGQLNPGETCPYCGYYLRCVGCGE